MNKLLWKLLTGYYLRMYAADDDDTGEAVGTGNDARIAMLNAINDKNDQQHEGDFADVNDDDTTTPFVAGGDRSADDAEAQAAADDAAAEAARVQAEADAAQVQQPQRIMRKVNGQDVEITEAMLVKAQKIANADVYLQEASRLRNELATKQLPVKTDAVDPFEAELADIAKAIQMGTEEEAVAALRKLSARPQPHVDEGAISRKIDERLTFNDAYNQFVRDYQDVVSDPVLFKLAKDRDDMLIRGGDTRPYHERFKETGDNIRAWMTAKTGVVHNAGGQTKLERKEALPQVVKAATAKGASQHVEEEEESPSQIIEAIARARGGPQWMQGAR